MKKNFCLITISLLLLTSCNSQAIDFNERPNDFPFLFWLNDTILPRNLNYDLVYKMEDVDAYLLDPDYSFIINESGEKVLPKEYILYTLSPYKGTERIVDNILITDPNVSIYGLSMKTDERVVNQRLISYGFKSWLYSGTYTAYSKDNYTIRIYSTYINVSYLFL